ncbi:DUF1127 domain-containing protein [Azospirillum sp. SYSU D00513]|uniref:DUF1127 domain-containing protein n=1 Tax=Azospirillum sp. SYSU D00513 TaxID=2812561 RepID=UPI001A9627FA|nr:DUF1127 domain-containing protein [Azospirillum sp. SYSU D00513]
MNAFDRSAQGRNILPAYPAASLPGRFLALLGRWIERGRQRRALEALDDSQLRDIGLTPLEARQEAEKPFWRE